MEKAVDLLKSLVNIPSSSGNEEEILIFLEKWFIEKQFDFVIRKETFVAGQIKAKGKKEQKKETKKDIIKSNLSVYWLDEKIEDLKTIKNIS